MVAVSKDGSLLFELVLKVSPTNCVGDGSCASSQAEAGEKVST
jgi:hypothetical protein